MAKRVGYKSPPEHTRWKKGQSGNPKGRAKGQHNLKTDLLAELGEIVQLNEAGVPRRLTKLQAFLKVLTAGAIRGDARAANLFATLLLRVLGPEAEQPGTTPLDSEDQALLDAFLARQQASKDDP